MTRVLPAFPEAHEHSYQTELNGAAVRLRLTWQERTASWYLDLLNADTGAAIVTGRRVSPLRAPVAGLGLADVVGRDEVLVVDGADPYGRLDLADSLRMLLIEVTEPVVEAPLYNVRRPS